MGEPMADKPGQNGGSKEEMDLSAHLCSQRKTILRLMSTEVEKWRYGAVLELDKHRAP